MADYNFNAELYDNPLTEKEGDFTARPVVNTTARNQQIAERIVEKRTEFNLKTIVNILELADQEKAIAVARGESVVDGMGHYLVSIIGAFDSATAKFDPATHSLGVSYNPGKTLRELLARTGVNITKAAVTGPVIGKITDSMTKKLNDTLTPGQPCIIAGSNIKIAGPEATAGVFFVKDGGTTALKCDNLVVNNPSELIAQVPALPDGLYRVRVVTSFANGSKQTKEARTTDFHILLTVGTGGGGESESPDEI